MTNHQWYFFFNSFSFTKGSCTADFYLRQFLFYKNVYGLKKISWNLSFDEWMSVGLLELDQASVCEYITTVKNTLSGGFLIIPNGLQCWINQKLFSWWCDVSGWPFLLRYNRDKKLILMHCAIEARDPSFRQHWSLLKLKTPFVFRRILPLNSFSHLASVYLVCWLFGICVERRNY